MNPEDRLVQHVIGNTVPGNKFGRKPKDPSKETVSLESHLDFSALPTPPAQLNWTDKIGSSGYGMMLNDRLGDCTCAAMGHARQVTSYYGRGHEITLGDYWILRAYEAVSGYDPKTGANDNGAYEPDVLKYWQQHGIGFYRHKIRAWAQFDHTDHTKLQQVIQTFGFAYLGTQVPQAWESAPDVWDVSNTPIVGGHAIIAVGYDDQYLYIVSWGSVYKVTWAAYDKYFDEAYAVIAPEWVEANGQTVNGLDLAGLEAALEAVK